MPLVAIQPSEPQWLFTAKAVLEVYSVSDWKVSVQGTRPFWQLPPLVQDTVPLTHLVSNGTFPRHYLAFIVAVL